MCLCDKALRFFRRVREHALAFVAQRQINRSRNLFADRGVSLDLLADRFDRGVGTQEAIGQGFVLAQQSQQQVLGLNVRRPELAGFVAREKDDSPGLLRITLEHIARPPGPSWPGSMAPDPLMPDPTATPLPYSTPHYAIKRLKPKRTNRVPFFDHVTEGVHGTTLDSSAIPS